MLVLLDNVCPQCDGQLFDVVLFGATCLVFVLSEVFKSLESHHVST